MMILINGTLSSINGDLSIWWPSYGQVIIYERVYASSLRPNSTHISKIWQADWENRNVFLFRNVSLFEWAVARKYKYSHLHLCPYSKCVPVGVFWHSILFESMRDSKCVPVYVFWASWVTRAWIFRCMCTKCAMYVYVWFVRVWRLFQSCVRI